MHGWGLGDWAEFGKAVGPLLGPVLAAALAIGQFRKLRDQQRQELLKARRGRAQELDAMLVSPGLAAARRSVDAAFPNGAYPDGVAVPLATVRQEFGKNAGLQGDLDVWLGHWESVALTVYAGTTDEDMAYEFVGGLVARTGARFREYIDDLQANYGRKAYCYLHALAGRWRARREEELRTGAAPFFLRDRS
jgi:hypothetical protein